MVLSHPLAVAAIVLLCQQPSLAQDRDISRPMQVLKASMDGLVLTRLNANGVDQRLALETAIITEHPVPPSFAEIKAMPRDMREAILEVCAKLMMPVVEDLDRVGGFPDVSGVRITLRSKPTEVGTGTYQTLIFPQERGCEFGW